MQVGICVIPCPPHVSLLPEALSALHVSEEQDSGAGIRGFQYLKESLLEEQNTAKLLGFLVLKSAPPIDGGTEECLASCYSTPLIDGGMMHCFKLAMAKDFSKWGKHCLKRQPPSLIEGGGIGDGRGSWHPRAFVFPAPSPGPPLLRTPLHLSLATSKLQEITAIFFIILLIDPSGGIPPCLRGIY